MPLGFPLPDLAALVAISLAICVTVCALAMEAAVIFTPAFLFVFPVLVDGFPTHLSASQAIGLSLFVEFFGYTSSVSGYWYREQIDLSIAWKVLAVSVPLAILARLGSALVPADVLLLAFGLMLAGLAGTLFEAHRHGASPLATAIRRIPGLEPLVETTPVSADYVPRTRLSTVGKGFDLTGSDRGIIAVGGVMAGLVGIAIGEVANTVLGIRKRVPIKISTGTSALVLHVTILAALVMTLLMMRFAPPSLVGHGFTIPLEVGAVIAPVVVVGGQIGSYVNSQLSEETTIRVLIAAYFLVGTFVVVRTLFLGH